MGDGTEDCVLGLLFFWIGRKFKFIQVLSSLFLFLLFEEGIKMAI